jgi:hypothetical protein
MSKLLSAIVERVDYRFSYDKVMGLKVLVTRLPVVGARAGVNETSRTGISIGAGTGPKTSQRLKVIA